MRAPRDEIRTRWRIRSLADLQGRLDEMFASALFKVRYYVLPSPWDTNPSRWPTHPLWKAARACMAQLIKLDDHRKQLIGLAAAYAALAGLPNDRAGDLPGLVAAALRDAERSRPGLLEEKLARAHARYGVLD